MIVTLSFLAVSSILQISAAVIAIYTAGRTRRRWPLYALAASAALMLPWDVVRTGFTASAAARPLFEHLFDLAAGLFLLAAALGFRSSARRTRKAEELFAESERMFHGYFDLPMVGIAVASRDGRLDMVNDKLCSMLGRRREDLLGRSLDEFAADHTADADARRGNAGESTSVRQDAAFRRFNRNDGSLIDTEVVAAPVNAPAGEIESTMFLINDVSDRRDMERALRHSDLQFRQVWNDSLDGMRIMDQHGTILMVNDAYCAMVGKPKEELIGRHFTSLYPAGTVEAAAAHHPVSIEPYLERRALRPDGSEVWFGVSTSLLERPEGEPRILNIFRDITESKRTMEQLREVNELYHKLMDASPDAIVVLDMEGHIVTGSRRCLDIFRLASFDDAVNRSILQWVSPREHDRVRKRLAEIFTTREVVTAGEYMLLKADGTPFFGEINSSVFHGQAGKPRGFISIIRDVTQRKTIEEELRCLSASLEQTINERTSELVGVNAALREKEHQQRVLLDSIPDLAWLKDDQSRFIAVNTTISNSVNSTPDAMVGKTDFDFFPYDLARQYVEDDLMVLTSGKPKRIEERYVSADGSERWIESLKAPIFSDNGRVVGTCGMARDITDRKQAEVILQESHSRLEQLVLDRTAELETANAELRSEILERREAERALRVSEQRFFEFFEKDLAGDYMITPAGDIVECNSSFLIMFGFTLVAEARAVNFRALFEQSEDFDEFLEQIRDRGTLEGSERRMQRRDGRIIYTLSNEIAEFDAEGNLVLIIGYVSDVTDKKILEEQLLNAQKMESIGRLAGGIAHEFNNVLAIVRSATEMLEAAAADNPKAKRFTNIIGKATERGASTARQLLLFARSEQPSLKPVSAQEVILHVMEIIEHSFPKSITLKFQSTAPDACILGDASYLEQALLNLAINAKDAMEQGGLLTISLRQMSGTETAAVVSGAHPQTVYVSIAVADTGTGMDEETLRKIFDPFFTTKERGKGTGLGLSIVDGVVKSHHGFVHVHSAPGAGTAFTLFFPLIEGCGPDPAENTSGDLRVGTETILLVDDESMLHDMISDLLRMKGYTILSASNGATALDLCRSTSRAIELVITDYDMPGMNGIELMQNLRPLIPEAKFIMMTGYVEGSFDRFDGSNGIDALIKKPFKIADLARTIGKVLG